MTLCTILRYFIVYLSIIFNKSNGGKYGKRGFIFEHSSFLLPPGQLKRMGFWRKRYFRIYCPGGNKNRVQLVEERTCSYLNTSFYSKHFYYIFCGCPHSLIILFNFCTVWFIWIAHFQNNT